MNRVSWPWAGVVLGLVLGAAWYAATRTTLLLAYGTPSTGIRTLSQVQGICDSGFGTFARTMSAQGASACAGVDHTAMLWNGAGFAGLLLILGCAAMIAYRATHRPQSDAASH